MATDAEILAAKNKMDTYFASIAATKASMDEWYELMTRCKIKDSDKYLELGEPASGTCQTGSANNYPGCAAESKCKENMASYNLSVSNWETANTNYENARDEYEIVRGSKTDEDVKKLELEGKASRTMYYVFGGIVIALIIAGVVIWFKYKK